MIMNPKTTTIIIGDSRNMEEMKDVEVTVVAEVEAAVAKGCGG